MTERTQAELWHCRYPTPCTRNDCRAGATVIVRYVDTQGRPLRQFELCERHAGELARSAVDVRGTR